MLKKNFIIFFLLSLYTTVLVHNAIPHHHHSETVASHNHHDPNSSHDHHHHADHEPENEMPQDIPEGDEKSILELHLLLSHSDQFYINQAGDDGLVKIKNAGGEHFPESTDIFCLYKFPLADSPPIPPDPDLNSFSCESPSGLRAPPVLG